MKAYGGVDVLIHVCLTWTLVRSQWSASSHTALRSGTHWIGGWVGPRACLDRLDGVEKRKFLSLPGLDLRPLGCRPARSQSLYRLSYPGSYNSTVHYYSVLSCIRI
jgi:hypothetical protein